MIRTRWAKALALGAALCGVGMAVCAEESVPETTRLRHAVACAPFKGDDALAELYHSAVVDMLKKADGIEYLEGPRALARRAPEFTFRINVAIVKNEDGQSFVTVTLEDAARRNGGRVALQGNMDPAMLYGSPDAVRAQVRAVLDSYRDGNGGSREGHVFNLGHGMSPDMNPDHVGVLVDEVHAYSAR